jgi:hypothetical protein
LMGGSNAQTGLTYTHNCSSNLIRRIMMEQIASPFKPLEVNRLLVPVPDLDYLQISMSDNDYVSRYSCYVCTGENMVIQVVGVRVRRFVCHLSLEGWKVAIYPVPRRRGVIGIHV